MKQQLSALTFLVAFSGAAFGQQQSEGVCKELVEASISAIESISKIKGVEQNLKDLSVKEIREIQQSRGSCAAYQEINKRTMSN